MRFTFAPVRKEFALTPLDAFFSLTMIREAHGKSW